MERPLSSDPWLTAAQPTETTSHFLLPLPKALGGSIRERRWELNPCQATPRRGFLFGSRGPLASWPFSAIRFAVGEGGRP